MSLVGGDDWGSELGDTKTTFNLVRRDDGVWDLSWLTPVAYIIESAGTRVGELALMICISIPN